MTISTRTIAITATAVVAVGLATGGAFALMPAGDPTSADDARTQNSASQPDAPSTAPATPSTPATATATQLDEVSSMLLYMAEEEKLAQDVYDALGELWGARIFSQIASSEATHQERVLTLLDAAGLEDPRAAAPGVFVDAELQALYDDLMEHGSVSAQAAIEVGVMIEERDIADLADAIAMTDDPAVVTVLESLLAASQNHLAAFERQLG
jgi:hypothetical protein